MDLKRGMEYQKANREPKVECFNVGRLVDKLAELGLDKNMLVVFTSDNGPWLPFKDHGGSAGLLRGGKGTTWEGVMREPTIFYWPGTIKPAVIGELGSRLDLLPTIAALIGADAPPDRTLDGYNISPVLGASIVCSSDG